MDLKEKIDQRQRQLEQNAKRSLGQNFLIDENIVSKIISKVELFPQHQIVEIGPGLGSITDSLDKGRLLLIELDRNLASYWKEKLYRVEEVDALKWAWESLDRKTNDYLLVSNLPYQISSRIVIEMSERNIFEIMILMFQKEVADRLISENSKDSYGFLSVVAQNFWKIQKVVFVSPNCFRPRPNVDSQVLMFKEKKSEIKNRKEFTFFVKSCFAERRKKLINKAKKMDLQKHFEDFFNKNKMDENIRAEHLSPDDYCQLFLHCQKEQD